MKIFKTFDRLLRKMQSMESTINNLGNRIHALETAERERAKGIRDKELQGIDRQITRMQEVIESTITRPMVTPAPKKRWWS